MCTGPNPGNYYIINTQLGPAGEQLAANNNINAPLFVIAAQQLMAQRWSVIGEPADPQRIVPLVDPGLEAAPAGNFVEALPAANFAWCMDANGDGYIIADPNTQLVWAINIAAEEQQIVLEPQGKKPLQVWRFLPA
ncbi:hypothetical protein L210DRAFT_3648702 [Boletus edulis BED1]|uniref:CCL2-like lectin domain-containing protein n=1 Tax=Boletus edulis BED1 TaxID=1328754 RepID=A0AAD4BMT9_BOLED|nr:hypothetical protein L210DRAFT_3658984 [Boletus edulis BED1]KAF8435014.1 hypothetical protein L210DRAFT_3648702 [Boletus edulis BED1]